MGSQATDNFANAAFPVGGWTEPIHTSGPTRDRIDLKPSQPDAQGCDSGVTVR
jgi:hypothetical protein